MAQQGLRNDPLHLSQLPNAIQARRDELQQNSARFGASLTLRVDAAAVQDLSRERNRALPVSREHGVHQLE